MKRKLLGMAMFFTGCGMFIAMFVPGFGIIVAGCLFLSGWALLFM